MHSGRTVLGTDCALDTTEWYRSRKQTLGRTYPTFGNAWQLKLVVDMSLPFGRQISTPDTGHSKKSASGPKRRFDNWSFRRQSGTTGV